MLKPYPILIASSCMSLIILVGRGRLLFHYPSHLNQCNYSHTMKLFLCKSSKITFSIGLVILYQLLSVWPALAAGEKPNTALIVSGNVTSSADGLGLPGANVLVKGTFTGTVTDIEGRYSLSVPNATDTLVF